jgi:hypothetical protein
MSAISFGSPVSSSPSQGRPTLRQPIPDKHPPAVNLSMMKQDVAFSLEQAETVGLGFALPPKIAGVVRIVRKNEARREVENAA